MPSEAALAPSIRRIGFLCDWLPPDFGAVGQYTLQRCRRWAEAGHRVHLIGFSSTGDRVELENHGSGALQIHWLRRDRYDKARLLTRLKWSISANWLLVRTMDRLIDDVDEVYFTGSPPLLLHFVTLANRWRWHRSLTYRITDFHPECLVAARGRAGFWLSALRALTWRRRRQVDHFEALGQDQQRLLVEGGIDPRSISVQRDDSPVSFIGAQAADPAALRGKRVILYSGNFGVAHDSKTFIEAYDRLHQDPAYDDTILWLNATGDKANRVEQALHARNLPVYRTQPYSLAALPSVLLRADCHLITLADAFVGYVLPSKVYAIAESAKPTLFIGAEASDVHLILAWAGNRYARCATGDVTATTQALKTLLTSI